MEMWLFIDPLVLAGNTQQGIFAVKDLPLLYNCPSK